MTRIEHANITVPDISAAIQFLQTAAPDFEVRRAVDTQDKRPWAHIGNDDFYFALQAPNHPETAELPKTTYSNVGVNHIALVVSDFDETVHRLLQAGYRQNDKLALERFRKRGYFYDDTGMEWEIVEYLSEKPAEKNRYEDS